MGRYMFVLCDYKEVNQEQIEAFENEETHNKTILYNEILDVIKCILYTFLSKHNHALYQNDDESKDESDDKEDEVDLREAIDHLIEELQDQYEDGEENERA